MFVKVQKKKKKNCWIFLIMSYIRCEPPIIVCGGPAMERMETAAITKKQLIHYFATVLQIIESSNITRIECVCLCLCAPVFWSVFRAADNQKVYYCLKANWICCCFFYSFRSQGNLSDLSN